MTDHLPIRDRRHEPKRLDDGLDVSVPDRLESRCLVGILGSKLLHRIIESATRPQIARAIMAASPDRACARASAQP
jgi:hypothetical protein